MAGGPRHHLKRLSAPSHWQLAKLGGIWAPRPSAGPHKLQECFPLLLILRNRLHLARDAREARLILNQRVIHVDGKVRVDPGYPTGFMDVVQIPKLKQNYRVMYDILGRFTLVPIKDEEANFKICRVRIARLGEHGVPYISTTDGRTVRFADKGIYPNDSVKVDLKTNQVLEHFPFHEGQLACVTSGAAAGRIGRITKIDENTGSYAMVHLIDDNQQSFLTKKDNVFIIGKNTPAVTLAAEKGLRPSKIESRYLRIQMVEKRHEQTQ